MKTSYIRKTHQTVLVNRCSLFFPAHVKRTRVAHLASWVEPVVDAACSRRPCFALHHPRLHGPADHCRHRQQEGEQTEGRNSGQAGWLAESAAANLLSSVVTVAERLWLPPGSAGGGRDAGCVLHHGPAMVCRCDRALHFSRQQPEGGVGERRARRAAKVLGHQRAAGHRLHDLHHDGLLRLPDLCPEGEHHLIFGSQGTPELSFSPSTLQQLTSFKNALTQHNSVSISWCFSAP